MADEDVEELQESLSQFRIEEPNTHLILVAAQKCVNHGKWKQLVDSLTRPEYKDALEFVGWELIGVISQAILDDFQSDSFQECRKILKVIAERCSAKEVCIGVLEQLDSESACHFNKFVALLDTLKIAINRLKEKKSKFVGMVLPCITRYIRGIQLSDEIVDQKESGSKCQVMQPVMEYVLDFLRPLVHEVSIQSCSEMTPSSSYIPSLQTEIVTCLIQLLDYPLAFLNLTKEGNGVTSSDDEDGESSSESKSSSVVLPYRQIAQEIMQFIQLANGSYLYLMEYTWKNNQNSDETNKTLNGDLTTEETLLVDEDEEQENKMYPVLGLSCFVYLLLVEEMEDMNFPAVFSFKYLLTVNMKSIFFLLSRTEHCVIYKGLELLDTLSKRLKEKSLVYSHQEFKDITDIVKALINIMTMCWSKKLRLKGVRILPNVVSKLDTRSQYGLLYTILEDCSHPGVAGLLIYLLKEQVDQALSSSVDESWFQGSRLMSVLQLVFRLPSDAGTEKDLVQETDRVMAALNCLRFILLRDESDKTKVWENFTAIEKDFMEPLRQTLKVTRIQYQAELTDKRDEITGNKSKKEKRRSIEFEVKSPDGKPLELMPLSDQCDALQSGLYSLDMMESVLARISEIASSRTRGGK